MRPILIHFREMHLDENNKSPSIFMKKQILYYQLKL